MAEPATTDYFKRIDDAKLARHFSAHLDFYFDGDAAAPTTVTHSMFSDYTLSKELAAEDTFPLGRVSNSTFTVKLNNTDQRFTLTNSTGPYFGKLKKNVKVVVYTGLLMEDETYETFQMGVFYTSDWDITSSSILATLMCYDRLYFLKQRKLPKMPIFYNTSIAALFRILFQALGVPNNELVIDSALEYTIPYGWLPGRTVEEALQSLTYAGMCTVHVDRYNRIVVEVPYKQREALRTLSGSAAGNAQIKSVSQMQASYKVYTGVDITYNNYTIVEDIAVATLNNQQLKPMLNDFTDVSFNSAPVLKVDRVMLYNTALEIAAMNVGTQSMDLFIHSNEELDEIDISVYGQTLESTEQTISFSSPIESEQLQKKRLSVSSVLMQSKEAAQEYGLVLNQIITDPNAYLSLSLRGDLTFDLGDVYVIDAPMFKINLLPIYFTRITFTYTGGLSCEVDGTNYNSLALFNTAYLAPGFFVKVPKTV